MPGMLSRFQRSTRLFSALLVCSTAVNAQGRQARLPASAVEPPELAMLKRAANQPVQARSPSLREVFDALRRQPGGAALIERARRAGARIPRDVALQPQVPVNELDGKTYRFAAAGSGSSSDALQGTPTMRVTRQAPSQSVNGFGYLYVWAWFPIWISSASTWGPLVRVVNPGGATSPVGAPYDVKPYLFIGFNATTPGWYAINVVADQSAFEARHFTGSSYQLIQSFPKPASPGSYSYPILVNLDAGYHYFTWANFDWMYASEVSVVKF